MRERQFTDCVDIVGASCKPFEGNRRYISTGAVATDHIDESDVEIVDYKSRPSRADLIVEPGTLLFAKMQGTKKTLYVDKEKAENIYSTGFFALKAKSGIISTRCLYHLLGSASFLIQKDKNCSGATQKAITNSGLKKIRVSIPDYQLQEAIADQLDKISSIIQMRRSELQKLDDLVKARFVEMFGDPEHNNKHWREKSLFKLCKVGSSKRIYQNELCEQGVPFLKISDLVCKMDKGSCKYAFFIPEEKYDELVEQGLVPSPGDILVTARGTLGRCYIIAAEDRFYFQDGMITWLSDFDESICSQYIAHLFSMKGVKKQIEGLQAGSTVVYLSIAMTKNLKIMVPPIDLQKDFIAFVQQVDKSKFVESIHVLKLIKEAIAKEVSHDRII